MKGYLGIDIGSISTKGVVIDENNNILAREYLWTEGDPMVAVKRLLKVLQKQLEGKDVKVVAVGTTGSARKLIGVMTGACVVKNEITAHAIGTTTVHPDVNTLCAAGTGSFLSSQAHRLGVSVEDFGRIALTSKKPTNIAARCTVFAESDLVHKAQIGHKKEDIIAGLCKAVVTNYLNNIGKGKKITAPIVFQGGVSKNCGVKKAFEDEVGCEVIVDENGHLMGAFGVAVLAKKSGKEKAFSFDTADIEFKTRGFECGKCANHCEIICVYREDELIDSWGNKCDNGAVKK